MISYIFLQLLHLIAVMGILASLVTHVCSYYHVKTGIWTLGLIFTSAFSIYAMLMFIFQDSREPYSEEEYMPLGIREVLHRLSFWKKIGISTGVVSGIIISAIFTHIIPSPDITFSAVPITLYSFLFVGVYWMKYRVLGIQLTKSALSDRVEAMFALAKMRDPSVIPLLVDALSEADSVQQAQIVNACSYLGDSRTLFPLLRLLSEAPPYRQPQLKLAVDRACKSIHTLCFGQFAPERFEQASTIANLDFARVHFHLSRLRHIHIEPTSAEFFQLEHFLTYAVNVIGQSYLKRHVTVHIHGSRIQLHPNLRNSLTNLCKKVIEHEAEA